MSPEMRRCRRRLPNYILSFCMIAFLFYGIGRLYYHFTDGFTIANIRSSYPYDPRWEVKPLTDEEQAHVGALLEQPYHYLGKECQSYVFGSADGKYVVKFFNYQRFKPQHWLKYFSFVPLVDRYCMRKAYKRVCKREGVFTSWCLAFNKLQNETGLLYLHLNKTDHLGKTITIFDKMGWRHQVALDDFEFLIQRRAHMLCEEVDNLMSEEKESQAQLLLQNLVNQFISEYQRGLADNDHALMQNTGVYEGQPIHIDVGQFVTNEAIKTPLFYMQELYTKTFEFRLWLQNHYPALSQSFDSYLRELYGDEFNVVEPVWRKKMDIFQTEG